MWTESLLHDWAHFSKENAFLCGATFCDGVPADVNKKHCPRCAQALAGKTPRKWSRQFARRKGMPKPRKALRPAEEIFAQAIVSGKTQAAAYELAFPGKSSSPRQSGWQLAKRPLIARRIEILKAKMTIRYAQ